MREAVALDQVGVIAQRSRRWSTSTAPRWPRSRRSPAAHRRQARRARPATRAGARSPSVGDDRHLLADQTSRTSRAVEQLWRLIRDALIAEWKNDRADPDSASGRCPVPGPEPSTPSCAWSRPRGMPKSPAGPWAAQHRGGPRRYRQRAAALHLGPLLGEHRSPLPDLRCHLRPGSNATRADRHRRAAGDQPSASHAPSSTATRACVVPGCGATRGLHAHHQALGRRRATRLANLAGMPTITGCTIAASSPSPVTQTT